jgi:hypothetical protein
VQVRAVVRRAGSAHAPEGVTKQGRGRRRCPLPEGSGDHADTADATDALPAQVGGLTTVWSARARGDEVTPGTTSTPERAAPRRARGMLTATQAWDEDDTPFPEDPSQVRRDGP